MSQIEKENLNECTRCLLTESWTAAGFMAMRTFEFAVLTYFNQLTNQSLTKKT